MHRFDETDQNSSVTEMRKKISFNHPVHMRTASQDVEVP